MPSHTPCRQQRSAKSQGKHSRQGPAKCLKVTQLDAVQSHIFLELGCLLLLLLQWSACSLQAPKYMAKQLNMQHGSCPVPPTADWGAAGAGLRILSYAFQRSLGYGRCFGGSVYCSCCSYFLSGLQGLYV
jgi:hypothetical protein